MKLPGTPERDAAWRMVDEGFFNMREHEMESLFTTGNGLVGTRGSLAEGTALSAPATFIAGAFDNQEGSIPGLMRAPNWAQFQVSVNGGPLRLDLGMTLEHRRILDLRQGILWREWRHRDASGRISRFQSMQLASLADRHLLLHSVSLLPENYGGVLTIEAPLLSRSVSMRAASGVWLEFVIESRVKDSNGGDAEWTLSHPGEGQCEELAMEVEIGKTYRLDRIIHVQTSREPGPSSERSARKRLGDAHDHIERVVDEHRNAWRTRWNACDVVIEADPDAQRAIRFASYHLVSAANPTDEHVSIGARGLTGSAYKGHVFWDTEIFMLPFFTFTYPEAARALLMYRYHTLPAARARAEQAGFSGALYAWESADTGEDVTPRFVPAPTGELIRIRVGDDEQHISADVAYSVFQYWHVSGDDQFLLDAGAEILMETARFWSGRARREEDGRYHIRGVIGPDEYHESVDDNAYTNGMAQWNLETAAQTAALLARRWPDRFSELSERLQLRWEEIGAWQGVAKSMYLGLDPQTGLIEQFQGYFALEDIDLLAYEPRTAPMDVLLGRERIQQTKIIKQADVVMLLHLLWDRFPAELREKNFRYYEMRTGHGSSLSPAIHAAMAARLGDVELAMRYFRQASDIDLSNTMGNAAGGVHMGALGGLYQAVVFGFAGLTLAEDGPRLHPHLPAEWKGLRFSTQWRGQAFPFDVRWDSAATPLQEVRP